VDGEATVSSRQPPGRGQGRPPEPPATKPHTLA